MELLYEHLTFRITGNKGITDQLEEEIEVKQIWKLGLKIGVLVFQCIQLLGN